MFSRGFRFQLAALGSQRAGVKLFKERLSLDPAPHGAQSPTSGASDLEPLLVRIMGYF